MSALAHSLLGQHDKRVDRDAGAVGKSRRHRRRHLQAGFLRDWSSRLRLQGAFEEYERTCQVSPDPYPCINAAAIALWLGDLNLSRARAAKARKLLEARPQTGFTHWDWATLGEAAMLEGDMDSTLRYYGKAVWLAPSHWRDIAVMRRQARRNLVALKEPRDRFEAVLAVGGLACFTGHRVDEPSRQPPRFPRVCVGNVASRIRKALDETNVRFGFSSAAGGADLLFIEQLLLRGGEPKIFLPFPAKDFVATSVGAEWQERFYSVLARSEATVHVLEAAKPADPVLENAAYARCNARIRAAAVEAGRVYDETPVLIAVLRQSKEEEKAGGTAEAVRQWEEQLSGKLVIIDPQEPPAAAPTG